jgi:hypothetical protein
MDNAFMIFNAILQWELSIGPPRLERVTWINESPIPVPIGTTANPQLRKEVNIWTVEAEKHISD